ncbi:MAG TPA: GntR family transcriptional regulator [Stellaceae bacterium]|nr:GntR family transcriptional regulator [Stellaceae bacterium]
MEDAPSFRPLRRDTISAQVHQHLRQQIIRGRYLPRQRVSENELAAALGVSRTPVREALGKLQDERLIETVPQRGTIIAPIPVADVYANQFVREALECATIARAAERASASDARRLRALLDGQREARESDDAFFAADEAMHQELMRIAGEPSVWRVVETAKLQLDRVRHLTVRSQVKRQAVLREHAAIVQRVVAHDAAGAVAAMRQHLRGVFASIEPIMREHPEFFVAAPSEAAIRKPA